MGCLFCDIIEGKVPSQKVLETDKIYAFRDINPQSPVHVLVIHKEHIKTIEDLNQNNIHIIGDLFQGVKDVARITGIDKDGYRVIINNGAAGGQVIWHMHIHVMGGRKDMGPMIVPE